MTPSLRFATRQHPIFVLGILQRSGTNYLNNLLLLHPSIQPPGTIWEDFHLAHADMLLNYAEATARHWPSQWKELLSAEMGDGALLRHLGRGIIGFMESQNEKGRLQNPRQHEETGSVSLISATPSVMNLHLFFDLFPDAAPIIVIRDGRALVESGVRSFGWDYEEAVRMWRSGARRIIDFTADSKNSGRFFLARYEDLFSRNQDLMSDIFQFLGLERSVYDFDAARNMPVMGSSDLAKTEGRVHWKAVEKRAEFNPLERAGNWSSEMRSRFAWLASREMELLGYRVEKEAARPIWNSLMDNLYGLELKVKHSFPAIGRRLKALRRRLLKMPAN